MVWRKNLEERREFSMVWQWSLVIHFDGSLGYCAKSIKTHTGATNMHSALYFFAVDHLSLNWCNWINGLRCALHRPDGIEIRSTIIRFGAKPSREHVQSHVTLSMCDCICLHLLFAFCTFSVEICQIYSKFEIVTRLKSWSCSHEINIEIRIHVCMFVVFVECTLFSFHKSSFFYSSIQPKPMRRFFCFDTIKIAQTAHTKKNQHYIRIETIKKTKLG